MEFKIFILYLIYTDRIIPNSSEMIFFLFIPWIGKQLIHLVCEVNRLLPHLVLMISLYIKEKKCICCSHIFKSIKKYI